LVAAMSSAAIADVTGVLDASAAIIGTFLAKRQRAKILRVLRRTKWKQNAASSCLRSRIRSTHRHRFVLTVRSMPQLQPLTAFCTAQRAHYQTARRSDRTSFDTTFEKLASARDGKPRRLARGSTAVLLDKACLSLALGNHEMVVVTIAAPRPGRDIAHFYKLPVGHISRAEPEG